MTLLTTRINASGSSVSNGIRRWHGQDYIYIKDREVMGPISGLEDAH